jgi:predicted transcriptional regulator
MGEFGDLTPLDVRLYRAVLTQPGRPVPEYAVTLESTSDEVDKCVARLAELGLLRPTTVTGCTR